MDAKTTAIVSHITIIGLIIALIQNNKNKDEFASFYIRQTLGIYIIGIISGFLTNFPIINIFAGIISLAVFILWLISLINAVTDKKAPLPIVGPYFQETFKSL